MDWKGNVSGISFVVPSGAGENPRCERSVEGNIFSVEISEGPHLNYLRKLDSK